MVVTLDSCQPSQPMPPNVRITDVSPRDGLQNEPAPIATADKARLVRALLATGVDEVEVTSFVSPKWVPQLGDAAELLAMLARDGVRAGATPATGPMLSALVPNEKGLDALLASNQATGNLIQKASVFTAASETFNQRNTNATIAQSLERFAPVITRAHGAGLRVRGYISCVVACPFEGPIAPAQVARVARQLVDLGADEIDLGDTIGVATPDTTRAMLAAVIDALGPDWTAPERLTLHLHDTFARAAHCVRAALEMGVRSFDGSAGGLGGCPYASTPARKAPGNIDTALLVQTIHAAGYATHVQPEALASAGTLARALTSPSDRA